MQVGLEVEKDLHSRVVALVTSSHQGGTPPRVSRVHTGTVLTQKLTPLARPVGAVRARLCRRGEADGVLVPRVEAQHVVELCL